MKSIAYAGMDVHPGHINVALVPTVVDSVTAQVMREMGIPVEADEERVLLQRRLENDEHLVRSQFRKWAEAYELRCCYEASSCGYVVYRWLREIGVACDVIAPSKTPKKAGERVKTDRMDALKLARCLRNGELAAVHVPGEEEEADRSLVRYRQGLVRDATRAKNRILKVLDRHGIRYSGGGGHFTQKHRQFLRAQHFTGGEEYAYREYLSALNQLELRLEEVERRIMEMAETERYAAGVGKLCCMRGIGPLTAMVLLTETFDFERFGKARQLMGYWGFGVEEESSGGKRWQGGITKTGNEHCRWMLVESAKHYRHPPGVSEGLKKRQVGQPREVVDHAWKAQHRLHRTYWRVYHNTGSNANKATVAVAREEAGFVWAIMTGRYGDGPAGGSATN